MFDETNNGLLHSEASHVSKEYIIYISLWITIDNLNKDTNRMFHCCLLLLSDSYLHPRQRFHNTVSVNLSYIITASIRHEAITTLHQKLTWFIQGFSLGRRSLINLSTSGFCLFYGLCILWSSISVCTSWTSHDIYRLGIGWTISHYL